MVRGRLFGSGGGFQRLEEEAPQHAQHEAPAGLEGGLWERHVELQPASSPSLHSYQQLDKVHKAQGADPFWDG